MSLHWAPTYRRAVAIALLAASCTNDPAPSSATVSCSMALTGAVEHALNCDAMQAVWVPAGNSGAFVLNIVGSPSLDMYVTFDSKPHIGIYQYGASGGPDTRGTISVSQGQSAIWVAGGAEGQGSFMFTLTSVVLTGSTSIGQTYLVHGTVQGTLTPQSSTNTATGTISLHGTF